MQTVLFSELEDAVRHSEADAVVERSVILFPVKLEERLKDCPFRQDVVPTYRVAKSFLRQIQTQDQLLALMSGDRNNLKRVKKTIVILGDDS